MSRNVKRGTSAHRCVERGWQAVRQIVLISTFLLGGFHSAAGHGAAGSVHGYVYLPGEPILHTTTVLVFHSGQLRPVRTAAVDRSGRYFIKGLAPGSYLVTVVSAGRGPTQFNEIELAAGTNLHLNLLLPGAWQNSAAPHFPSLLFPPPDEGWGTRFLGSTRDTLPGSNDPWYLLENLEVSTIPNRVDIGGLFQPAPALLSVGGASWTQNDYRLNGSLVTDPLEPGRSLYYPALVAVREFTVSTADHPPFFSAPGGTLNFKTRRAANRWHGSLQFWNQQPWMQSENLDSDLRGEGLSGSDRVRLYSSGHSYVSGPLQADRLHLVSSFEFKTINSRVAGFGPEVESDLRSGLFQATVTTTSRGEFSLLWTSHSLEQNHLDADFRTAEESSQRSREDSALFQFNWRHSPSSTAHLSAGLTAAKIDIDQFSREEPAGQAAIDFFPGRRRGAAFSLFSERRRLSARFQLENILSFGRHGWLQTTIGAEYTRGDSVSLRDLKDGLLLIFDSPTTNPHRRQPQTAAEVIQYNTPVQPESALDEFSIFLVQGLALNRRLRLQGRLRFSLLRGRLPEQRSPAGPFVGSRQFSATDSLLHSATVDPGLSLTFILPRSGATTVRAGFARYRHLVPGSFLEAASGNGLTSRRFAWLDANGDSRFQPSEVRELLQVRGGEFTRIDPRLKRPFGQEFFLQIQRPLSRYFQAAVTLRSRTDKRRIQLLNTGLSPGDFVPIDFVDPGGDGITGTADDLTLTLFEQRAETLGQDRYLLTNPPGLESDYRSLEVLVVKRFPARWHFHFGFSAFEAKGPTNPGNSELENDPGVLGRRFNNPNNRLNTDNRHFFDRAFTGRIAGYYRFGHRIQVGAIAKYFDGRPFGRRLPVRGFNQGLFFVMATPPGNPGGHRTEFHLNVDLRVQEEWRLNESGRLHLAVDVFNLFNFNNKTLENDLTGPSFLERTALRVQAPRSLRWGLLYRF